MKKPTISNFHHPKPSKDMKNLLFFALILLSPLTFWSQTPGGQRTPEEIRQQFYQGFNQTVRLDSTFRYPMKSAKIEYQFTGNPMLDGTQTKYISNYGDTVLVITNRPHPTYPEHTTLICRRDTSIVINHLNRTWYYSKVRSKETEPPAIALWSPEQRLMGNYQTLAPETIAGKTTDVYKNPRTDVAYWIWNSVDLKWINGAPGSKRYHIKEAISVQEGVKIPANLIQIPANYQQQQ